MISRAYHPTQRMLDEELRSEAALVGEQLLHDRIDALEQRLDKHARAGIATAQAGEHIANAVSSLIDRVDALSARLSRLEPKTDRNPIDPWANA